VRLHVDLETLQLIEGPGFRNPVTSLRFKRGDAAQLEVVFLEDGTTAAEIGDPATLELQFGIKPRGRYDVGYLVHEAGWTLPEAGAPAPVYLCSPSFNTVELDSAMQVGSSAGSELSEITLMGEITWREGTGDPTSTRTFTVVVENDVNRGTEGVPESADPPYPPPGDIELIARKGVADGYAGLDGAGKLPTAHLPEDWLDERAVRFDQAQALSESQQSQARDNIGVGTGKHNLAAASAPTVDDDSSAGYSEGSIWIDTTADESYRCVDATAGAAVWINTTLTADELHAVATQGVVGDPSPQLGGNLDFAGHLLRNMKVGFAESTDYFDVSGAPTEDTLQHNGANILVVSGRNTGVNNGFWRNWTSETTKPVADGSHDGQLLVILFDCIASSGGYHWTLKDSGNTSLQGDFVVSGYWEDEPQSMLVLRWDASAGKWREMFRRHYGLRMGSGSCPGANAATEGFGTIASGENSHAEGSATIASASSAHAEGTGTTASGSYGSHAEGDVTTASGEAAHAEGRSTVAAAQWSHAKGYYSNADKIGQMAHAIGRFGSNGDAQYSRMVGRRATVDATPAYAGPNQTSGILVPVDTAWNVRVEVVAAQQGMANVAKWDLECLLANNNGTPSFSGPSGAQSPDRTIGSPGAWTVELLCAPPGYPNLFIKVTGAASTSIRWVATIHLTEVSYP